MTIANPPVVAAPDDDPGDGFGGSGGSPGDGSGGSGGSPGDGSGNRAHGGPSSGHLGDPGTADHRRTRAWFHTQMGLMTGFTVLTSGVFLSGLAAHWGASDVLISYLSVIMNICGALILVLAPLIERFRSRKRVTIALTIAAKTTTVAIVAVPLLVPATLRLPVFVALIILAFTLQAQAQVSLNNWLIHFVEAAERGRYISARMTIGLVTTVVLSVLAGWYVDQTGGGYEAFAVLFAVAGILGVGEVATLARIEDSPGVGTPPTGDTGARHPGTDKVATYSGAAQAYS